MNVWRAGCSGEGVGWAWMFGGRGCLGEMDVRGM